MPILFIKRLFLRIASVVWILLLFDNALMIFGMAMFKAVDIFFNGDYTEVFSDPKSATMFANTLTLLDNLWVPVIVLTAGTGLGVFVTMTMAQGIADDYNFTSWQQASVGINATMNYDATMRRTKQTLDHTAAEAGQTVAMPAPNQASAPVAAAPGKGGR